MPSTRAWPTRPSPDGSSVPRAKVTATSGQLSAFAGGATLGATTSVQALTAGLALAIVLLAGCLVLAVLRPQPGGETAPIVMESTSGALYVRLGETLHPVLNLASARLIAKTNADPQPIATSEFGRSKLGPLLGIPGA